MKVYLAAVSPKHLKQLDKRIFLLESFAYIDKHKEDLELIKKHDLLIDSGAFTFIYSNKNKLKIDWDEYIEKYIQFIVEHDIKNFFELDIESIVGMDKMHELRYKLEKLTNKQSIPVFHKERGKDYWLRMVQEYDYVAIGGITSNASTLFKILPWFLKTAKEHNCKVHGLGFTRMKFLHEMPFYSVDSTTWLNAGKYGEIHHFNGRVIKKLHPSKMGKRTKEGVIFKMKMHNMREWIKFQKYAYKNL